MTNFTNTDDIIDVRDIIARVEELRESRDEYNEKMDDETAWVGVEDGEPEELETLEKLLEELKGCGGDEQWEGDWYPMALIRDSYFENYAQELAEDCGMVNADAKWPNNCIDWEKAARELQWDYTSVDFGDSTYWYR
jgi:hypothetical protein